MSIGLALGSLLGKAGSAFATGIGTAAGSAIGTKIGGGSTDINYNIYQGGSGGGTGSNTLLDQLAVNEMKAVEGMKQKTEQMILQQEQAKLDRANIDASLQLGKLQLEADKLGLQYQREVAEQAKAVAAQQKQAVAAAVSVKQMEQMAADKETSIIGSLVTTLAINRANQSVQAAVAQPVISAAPTPTGVQTSSNMPMIAAAVGVAALGLILILKKR